MTYIYDILLNFNDDERIIEFYEWKENDALEHIKRILLFKISSKQMDDLNNYQIKMNQEFLSKIKGATISYKNKKDIKYGALFSDLNKVIALEFNKDGEVISRSGLLLDEEEDIIEECNGLYEEKIEYEKSKKYKKENFLTREELLKKRYLLKELSTLYQEKNEDKINYLYEELFPKDNLSLKEKIERMRNEIEKNFSEKHNELYEIVRLTYTKK